jgi:hypothetical protein
MPSSAGRASLNYKQKRLFPVILFLLNYLYNFGLRKHILLKH